MYIFRKDRKWALIDFSVLQYAGQKNFRLYLKEMINKHGITGLTLKG